MKPGTRCEAVQIGHPAADSASQRNVPVIPKDSRRRFWNLADRQVASWKFSEHE